MNINEDIPDRELGEQDEELLDKLWSKLSVTSENEKAEREAWFDLQDRLHRKRLRRITFGLAACGSVAAVLAVVVWMWISVPVAATSGLYSQLAEMGVESNRQQVTLTMDDAVVMQLDSVARMEQRSVKGVALRTTGGKELALEKGKRLKITVPAGGRFRLTLADSSVVWLNAGSMLEYPATFERGAERRVKLQGEAFFEVKRDTASPFYVDLGQGESIRVLGTSFNVNAYPGAEEHVTTLLTGKIGYRRGEDGEEQVLLPDQQVKLDCQQGSTKVVQVDAASYASWKEGWIWFENEALPKLAERLSRLYGIQIEVDARCKNYSFSGKIRFERGIDYITKLLTETTDIRCKVVEGRIKLE